ncbi:ABC transporter ATP-binding protein [Phocaeicola sp.]
MAQSNSSSSLPIVSVDRVCKRYGKKVQALREVSLSVYEGELFGIIGPDGAGKTTLFHILTTLLAADSGSATLSGWNVARDIREIRSNVGYMPGRFSLYQDLSVEENLNFFASLFGVKVEDNYHLIAPIYSQIERFKTRRAGKLSGGMKQKLALCCAMIHSPKILFLDEPTTGVDPVSRKEFWQMLLTLKQQGVTILVSTPYMDEASLCDRIALCKDGVFQEADTPQKIISNFSGQLYALMSADRYGLLLAAKAYPGTAMCYPFGNTHHLIFDKGREADVSAFLSYLKQKGFNDVQMQTVEPNVEDCFIQWSQLPH